MDDSNLPLSPSELTAEASAELGDARRTSRQETLLSAMASHPTLSFPALFEDGSDLEAAYRFVENEHFGWHDAMAGHRERTAERCTVAGSVLLVHDTTDIQYQVHDEGLLREHLMRGTTQTQGYLLHLSLAVSEGPRSMPLGVLAATPFVHSSKLRDEEMTTFWNEHGRVYKDEPQRWYEHVDRCRAQLDLDNVEVIDVMDWEGDAYPLLAYMRSKDYDFVVRVKTLNRKLADSTLKLDETLGVAPFRATMDAKLGFRTPFRNQRKQAKHPPRKARHARLSVRATTVSIKGAQRPDRYWPDVEIPERIELNVVEVVKQNPPEGQEPVRWFIWTTLPVKSPAQMLRVALIYYRRWVIEEYFKTLKTGCKLEERQLRTAANLLRVFAPYAIIAWWLLAMREMSQGSSSLPWTAALTPVAFLILQQSVPKAKLSDTSTVSDVLAAIARLGGHLKSNGPPGWQTLIKGLLKLYERVEGARLYAATVRDT